MGKKVLIIFEVLIAMTLFAMYSSLMLTEDSNDEIINTTEEFVETVRYKGCITDDMYYEFLNEFNSPVDIRFIVTRKGVIDDTTDSMEFTHDVINAINSGSSPSECVYKMNVGDEIQVIVRKPSGTSYNTLIGSITGQGSGYTNPVIALKGGMILNTQYPE